MQKKKKDCKVSNKEQEDRSDIKGERIKCCKHEESLSLPFNHIYTKS